MKKYLIVSFIIHLLPFLFGINFTTNPVQQNESQASMEQNRLPIELVEDGDKSEAERPHYWGIGTTTIDVYLERYGFVSKVVDVYRGYSAHFSGIKSDDLIILVNGKPQSETNDIKGDGPANLTLTILRNSVIIQVNLKRVKVYY